MRYFCYPREKAPRKFARFLWVSFVYAVFVSIFLSSCAQSYALSSNSYKQAVELSVPFLKNEPVYLWLSGGNFDPKASSKIQSKSMEKAHAVFSAMAIPRKNLESKHEFLLAVNKTGLFVLGINQKTGVATMSQAIAASFFEGYTFSSIALSIDFAYCLLYADDSKSSVFGGEAGNASLLKASATLPGFDRSASVLLNVSYDDRLTRTASIRSEGKALHDLFAIIPAAVDRWYAQTRIANGNAIESAYYRFDPSEGNAQTVSRKEFESGPLRPSTELPPACEALPPDKPFFVLVAAPDGSRYCVESGSGDRAEASECYAAQNSDGFSCCIYRSGEGFYSFNGAIFPFSLQLPSADAAIVDLAVAGRTMVFVWQEDYFPEIGASGIGILHVQ